MKENRISILGSTGSIGTQALKVCEALGLTPAALTAYHSAAALERQARRWRPAYAACVDEAAARDLKVRLHDTDIRVGGGEEALCEAASMEGCAVLNAVVGMAGLPATLRALEAGHTVALANKETLVAAGELVMRTAEEHRAALLPVDSEHSAIFQCLQGNDKKALRRILLTASGGPFYGRSREELRNVTPADALCHPNWTMGAKITIDSATLMNKGLEFIEAMWLFGVSPEQIEVLVHRQSVVHSAVEYGDGSVIAQLGVPDMALPIQYALTYPERAATGLVQAVDLFSVGTLTFAPPDEETFGCLGLAKAAAARGGLAPCVLNAANEAAVALFLLEKIGFLDIEALVAAALENVPAGSYSALSEVLETERAARDFVQSYAEKGGFLRS